jgi:hypothetical protein
VFVSGSEQSIVQKNLFLDSDIMFFFLWLWLCRSIAASGWLGAFTRLFSLHSFTLSLRFTSLHALMALHHFHEQDHGDSHYAA